MQENTDTLEQGDIKFYDSVPTLKNIFILN